MNHLARIPIARLLFSLVLLLSMVVPGTAGAAPAASLPRDDSSSNFCEARSTLCVDPVDAANYEGNYIGHDEPSLLFYSATPGSGNNYASTLVLPRDPPVQPNASGKAGTWNFQLHPAFWYGMAMCDTQSAPEYTTTCVPDSDANIFDGPDPRSANYIGHHPGVAFMEMQFYPPGWVPFQLPGGTSCDPTKWCAALNIDSLGQNQNNGVYNNSACLNSVGAETVNFAFITLSGTSQAPANPVDATSATYTPDPSKDLFMASGDAIRVHLFDTADGFKVTLDDLTSGQSGSMTASPSNGFGQVVYDPNATTCTVNPYAFHPMYATSTPSTRVVWAAHSYNVAFSDEIGHWEYCLAANSSGNCTQAGATDPSGLDADDTLCFAPPSLPSGTLVQVGGCYSSDQDYDGPSYGLDWPGTSGSPVVDRSLHPRPITFTSFTFGVGQNYSQVAFESDMPRVEQDSNPATPCDTFTGANCTNPPPGAQFYPIYTTASLGSQCVWHIGGPAIPGTTNTFGGTSTAEYGSFLALVYPTIAGAEVKYDNFRHVLLTNPCPAGTGR